jgi:ABC-2 type transport system permease protein
VEGNGVKKTIVKYLKLTWEIKKINLLSEMEYRASFILQVIGNVFIISSFALLWILFFKKVPTLGSWQLSDMVTLIAVSWTGDALLFLVAGGLQYLARMIALGQLDYFILLPHNMLWHIAVSKTENFGISSLIVAITLFYLFGDCTPVTFLRFGAMSVVSAAIMFNYVLLTQSLGFFFGNFENGAKKLLSALYSLQYYPNIAFTGVLRFITMFIIPSYFSAALPAQMVHHFDWLYLFSIVIFWAVSLWLALFVYKRGLVRYESGNLIQVKM